MFGQNLRFYRLRKGWAKKELAEALGVSPTVVSEFESGKRKPSIEDLRALKKALDVRVPELLAVRDETLRFQHGEFRKNASLSKSRQEYVRESVEEYFSRFMTIVKILGRDALPPVPKYHAIPLDDDDEKNARNLRRYLGISKGGPVDDLIGRLEDEGFLVFEIPIDDSSFSGMNGLVDGRPYIVLNQTMSAERIRSTIAHELAHLAFIWNDDESDSDVERRATAIAGAFLFPQTDVKRELGTRCRAITKAHELIAKEYGVSMLLLAKRANACRIVDDSAVKSFFILASKMGWRTNEPSRIEKERPGLFEQLVYRAVNENVISVQKGAEALKMSYEEVASMRVFQEESVSELR